MTKRFWKKLIILVIPVLSNLHSSAQMKPRPDAFPPVEEQVGSKSTLMATTVEEMAAWDRYPTYDTYQEMMRQWAETYPDLCSVDTIGTSIQGRLILALHIEGNPGEGLSRPQFFYSSTIHGDEVTGYVMMLRLIDTLLSSHGTDQRLTDLVNSTDIYINPLANPDGTYWRSDNTVQGSRRYNANGIDLNRTFPNPFAPTAKSVPQENQAMIDYAAAHSFRLSANLHGGAEVLNYPWDSFRSDVLAHPDNEWWKEICRELIDTLHTYSHSHFCDVSNSGYIAGGDWYVIDGGRQDYMNYYHNCLEMTIELSTVKNPDSDQLPEYWSFLSPMLIRYIEMIHHLPASHTSIDYLSPLASHFSVYPNPATDHITASGTCGGQQLTLSSIEGRILRKLTAHDSVTTIDLNDLQRGVYLLRIGNNNLKIIKQ